MFTMCGTQPPHHISQLRNHHVCLCGSLQPHHITRQVKKPSRHCVCFKTSRPYQSPVQVIASASIQAHHISLKFIKTNHLFFVSASKQAHHIGLKFIKTPRNTQHVRYDNSLFYNRNVNYNIHTILVQCNYKAYKETI